MNIFLKAARNLFTNWLGDGPWRSKSVLVAIVAVAVGLGLWFSDIKNPPPQSRIDQNLTNSPGITVLDSKGIPTAGAHWNWRKPFPSYVRIGASYVAAYCIGWLFRRLMRLLLLVSVLAVGLLAYGKVAGWDTTRTQKRVQRSGEWAQQAALAEKDHLKGLLPSATAAGFGIFMGFRRRNRVGAAPHEPPRSEK